MMTEEDQKRYKKKRTLAIVLMLTIIEFSFILIVTTFTPEFLGGIGKGFGEGKDEPQETNTAFVTLQYGSNIDFLVPFSLLNIGAFEIDNYEELYNDVKVTKDEEKITITDNTNSQSVFGLSTLDNTGSLCSYDIIFTIEQNNFEKVYLGNTVMNELYVTITGHDQNNKSLGSKVLLLDGVEPAEYKVAEAVKVESHSKDVFNQYWNMEMSFINYRNIIQDINYDKHFVGTFKFDNIRCDRVK